MARLDLDPHIPTVVAKRDDRHLLLKFRNTDERDAWMRREDELLGHPESSGRTACVLIDLDDLPALRAALGDPAAWTVDRAREALCSIYESDLTVREIDGLYASVRQAYVGDPTTPSPEHALDVGDLVEFDDDRYGVKRARVGTTPGVHVVLLSNGYGHTVPITSVRLVAPFDEVCPHVDEEGHPQEGTIITRSDGSQVCWSCGFIPYDPPAAPSGVSEPGEDGGR